MKPDPVLKAALDLAITKLNEAIAAREEHDRNRMPLDRDVLHWEKAVDALREVCEPAEDESDPSDVEISAFVDGKPGKQTVKFTDGVRMVLQQNRGTMIGTMDIRAGLLNLGFDFSKYSQPMTPIHNCLKRLFDQGEVQNIKTVEGQTIGYKWISPIERALYDKKSAFNRFKTAHDKRQLREKAKRILDRERAEREQSKR